MLETLAGEAPVRPTHHTAPLLLLPHLSALSHHPPPFPNGRPCGSLSGLLPGCFPVCFPVCKPARVPGVRLALTQTAQPAPARHTWLVAAQPQAHLSPAQLGRRWSMVDGRGSGCLGRIGPGR